MLIVIPIAAAVLAPVDAAQPDTAQPPSPSRFPAGPGRDALFHVCSNCHGPESVLGHLKTHNEWSKTLDVYSLIFINTATAKELESTLDVAPTVAAAIVRRRAEHGSYTSIDDLAQVPGVAARAIEARKHRLIF